MADNVVELNDSTFDETVYNSEIPVLVDFWAPWCGPCKMMGPIIEEIADDYAGRVSVCKLNTGEAQDSAKEFNISAIPTLILFKNNEVKKRWVGLTSKKDITSAIDELL